MFEVFVVLMNSGFVCSFSSVLSAAILICLTIGIIAKMYWMIVSVVPLYLFSLFMLGGLYVLIGFVMMSDIRDLDMIFSGEKFTDLVISFSFLLIIVLVSMDFSSIDFSFVDWSVIKEESQETWGFFSSTYVFLMFLLLIYLYVMFMMSKGSWGGGGFVEKSWGVKIFSFAKKDGS